MSILVNTFISVKNSIYLDKIHLNRIAVRFSVLETSGLVNSDSITEVDKSETGSLSQKQQNQKQNHSTTDTTDGSIRKKNGPVKDSNGKSIEKIKEIGNAKNQNKSFSRRFKRKLDRERRTTFEIRRISHGNQQEGTETKKSTYFRNNCSLPWVDDSLWTTIGGSLPKSLPLSKPKVSRGEIASSDYEASKTVLSSSGSCGNSWISCFTQAAECCSIELGIDVNSKRDKFDILSITDAVEFTSKNTNSGLPFSMKKSDPKSKSWVKKIYERFVN